MRRRVRVISISDDEVQLRLTAEQSGCIQQCLHYLDRPRPLALHFFADTSSDEVMQLADRFPWGEGKEYTLGSRELRLVYLSLAHALSQFVREEDFHIRIGWYRDDVRDLAMALWVGITEFSSEESQ